jgi:hypothetical protein
MCVQGGSVMTNRPNSTLIGDMWDQMTREEFLRPSEDRVGRMKPAHENRTDFK